MSEAFKTFVNRELPRRSALLTYEITGYDGNPNDIGAPQIITSAPLGTWYHEQTQDIFWRKYFSGTWFPMSVGDSFDEDDILVDDATSEVVVSDISGNVVLKG